MAENLTLEQELQTRIFIHKISITGGVLMKEYIDRERQGSVKLPTSAIQDMADQYSNEIIQKTLQDVTFEDLYNNAWNKIKYTMPEHTKVI
jgi:hypothetical protein